MSARDELMAVLDVPSEELADTILSMYARELAEKIRKHDYDLGEVGAVHLAYRDAADLIDPHVR